MRRNRGLTGRGLWPTCPGCEAPIRPGASFCPRCGADLSDPDALPVDPAAAAARAESRASPRSRAPSEHTEIERLWRLFRPVLWLYLIVLALVGGISLYTSATGNTSPWIDVVVTSIEAIIVFAFVATEWRSTRPLLGGEGLSMSSAAISLLALAGVYLFLAAYFHALRSFGAQVHAYLADFREHGWPLWSAFALISISPAVLEELTFRGYVQGRLSRIVEPGEAILIQAALFSVVHLVPLIFVSHFVIGLVLGWLRNRTRSLYPCMLLHASWNAIVLLEELGLPTLL